MAKPDESDLSDVFASKRAAAEAFLWAEMEKLGLLAKDGWRISESVRDGAGGSELVLRPVHRSKAAPAGLECVVQIVEHGHSIESRCSPGDSGAEPTGS